MSSNPWGAAPSPTPAAGAWALDAEEEERSAAAAAAIAGVPAASFPSLLESVATKPKKKKPVTMPLAQLHAGAYTAPASRSHPVDTLSLPTGPRERSAEELDSSRLGGGFRSYGAGDRGAGPADRGPRRGYGGFDDDQRRAPSDLDRDQPSRADEVDNWAAGKKSFTPSLPSDRDRDRDRYSSLGGGSSRADDIDNWSAGKKAFTPSSRPSSFGTGFRDTDGDRWGRGGGGGGGGGGAPPPSNGDRPRIVLNPVQERPKFVLEKKDVGSRPSLFGGARPREEVLKEKGVDVGKLEPESAHSARPGSPVSLGEGAPAPARAKVNPFGDAKPREVLLQQQGKDWRKIDFNLEHSRVNRPETDEEKALKEEIDNLNKALAKEGEANPDDDSSQAIAEKLSDLRQQINEREHQLEKLICDLDDKVRFAQRTTSDSKPGFGGTDFGDRPRSRGSTEFGERPRSRGGVGDAWEKPMDEKRRGRESSFFGARNAARPRSREGW